MHATQVAYTENGTAGGTVLYMAIELSASTWKLGLSATLAGKPRRRDVDPYSEALLDELRKAKAHFGLPAEAPVRCCLEAGRDGFAPSRWLRAKGLEAVVIDPASVEVNRRKRRAKTDRIDVELLLNRLIRHENGEPQAIRAVREPSEAEEDDRRPHRELQRLTKERTAHFSRIKALLATAGLRVKLDRHFADTVDQLTQPSGASLPANLRRELQREWARACLCEEQMRELGCQIAEEQRERQDAVGKQTRLLTRLRGVGPLGARILSSEFFAWRELHNAKEVGALAGLAPAPWNSGSMDRDQGISKAGNGRVRRLMVQLAWSWARYQPDTDLARSFREHAGSKRAKRVAVVALARKLLIALWRFVQMGVVPNGATLAPA